MTASAQEARAGRHARQVRFPGQEEGNKNSGEARAAAAKPKTAADDAGAKPNTRFFLPNLFGPGPILPNPLCRDECFNDFDCSGNSKCCLRDCNKCEGPSFF